MKEETKVYKSGAGSKRQARLDLIPHQGLINAARRFELGLEEYKDKSYNALSKDQTPLDDKEWLIDRCNHAIEHCYRVIDYLREGEIHLNPPTVLGDAGGIAWAGLVLGESFSRFVEKREYFMVTEAEVNERLTRRRK